MGRPPMAWIKDRTDKDRSILITGQVHIEPAPEGVHHRIAATGFCKSEHRGAEGEFHLIRGPAIGAIERAT
ncbi:hypothetical protein DC522_19420 [Microvirga sp. KLBC 81]|nr:hypothetical protein DC522_19420 [Microvirga sp. KLBC 81]